MQIEKTTKIGELLDTKPEKAELLLSVGMHCLGCPASREETLEEACMVHGIDVEELLKELNKYICIVVVSHDISVLLNYAKNVAHINKNLVYHSLENIQKNINT